MDGIHKASQYISSLFGGAPTELASSDTSIKDISNSALGQMGVEKKTKLRFKVHVSPEDIRKLDENGYANLWNLIGNKNAAALMAAEVEEVAAPKPEAKYKNPATGQILSDAEYHELMDKDFPKAMGMDPVEN